MESSKKELKDLREKVSQLQTDLADREVREARTWKNTAALYARKNTGRVRLRRGGT